MIKIVRFLADRTAIVYTQYDAAVGIIM